MANPFDVFDQPVATGRLSRPSAGDLTAVQTWLYTLAKDGIITGHGPESSG